jgi:hypothetical protein
VPPLAVVPGKAPAAGAVVLEPELARTFQQAVIEIGTRHGVVSEQSIDYWRAASDDSRR